MGLLIVSQPLDTFVEWVAVDAGSVSTSFGLRAGTFAVLRAGRKMFAPVDVLSS
jgi:hypothetical protein